MAARLPSRGQILGVLEEAPRALHARELATRLRVKQSTYPKLLELLDRLALDGIVVRTSGNRFRAQRLPDASSDSWEGILTVHPRGFGFVAAVGHDDAYIAPDGIGGALHGDLVRARMIGRSSRGVEGRIEAIVKRRADRVAGTLRRRRTSAWLEPDDTRIRGPIVLPIVPAPETDGQAAVVRITRYPETLSETPEGELVEVLGHAGDPDVEVAKILVREQIVEPHPPDAVAEAERIVQTPIEGPGAGRVDLRSVPLLTIDPEDARDHDDAVWAERMGDGYRAYIAIADVSEYVRPGSAMDEEAHRRGVTIYLPDRAIPMLPQALAANYCSLLAERERLCLCAVAEVDASGKVVHFDVVEGVMRSAADLTYGAVARALGYTDRPPPSPTAHAFLRDLKVLDEVARKLRRNRMRRGALDFDLPEPRVVLDEETGAPSAIERRATDPGVKRAYQIVEELMILANELVAQWLIRCKSPAIFRVHDKPNEEKLERLARLCEALGAPFDADDMLTPKGVSRWLAQIADHPRRSVLEMLLLRSMKQAQYDISNIGHFGLASDAYLHFTSPIRRYPDIEAHRAVKALLRGGTPDNSPAAIAALTRSATESSARERAAMEIEREVVDVYRALFMREAIGELFEGTVTAFVGSGLYVTLDHPFVDVLVRYESLGPDQYELNDSELSVVGRRSGDRVNLGDRMTVQIEDTSLVRRAVFGQRIPPERAVRAPKAGRRGKRDRKEPAGPPRSRRQRGVPEGTQQAPRKRRKAQGKHSKNRG